MTNSCQIFIVPRTSKIKQEKLMSFDVTVQPSGHQFTVKKDEFILDAALRQGISFPYGCRSGTCATCLGNVLSGSVEYPKGLPLSLMENEHEQGKALFCSAVATSSLVIEVKEIVGVTDIQAKTLPARVASLRKLSHDVMEMTLKLPATERLQFRSGQYIEFLLRDGKRRAFSIANSPSNDEYVELHLRLIEGGYFTQHVFNEMKEKALVRINGPLGTFFIRDDSKRPLIFIAGGTGFAPIKSMVEKLIEEGDKREMHIYWGVRAQTDLYSDHLPKKWDYQHENIHYVPVLSATNESDNWEGREGFVHKAVATDFNDLSAYDVYMAGPPPMINAAKELFIQQGLAEKNLFSDSFEYSEDS